MYKQADEQTVLPLAGPTSWATQGPALRRAPRSVKCSAVTILKFLIILPLNVCFVSEFQQDNEHAWEQRRYLVRIRALCHHGPQWRRCPLGMKFQWTRQEQETRSKYKVSVSYQGAADNLEKPCFLFKPQLASNAEKKAMSSKNHRGPRNPIIHFLIRYFPALANHPCRK